MLRKFRYAPEIGWAYRARTAAMVLTTACNPVVATSSKTISGTIGQAPQEILDQTHGTVKGVAEDPIGVTYDSLGRIGSIQQGAQSATYSYDLLNRPIIITDALGNQTTYTYDGADRIASWTLPGGQVSQFAYDGAGNRTQVTLPSGAVHALTYTPLDQYGGYTPPGNGSFGTSYDLDGAVITTTLPINRTEVSSYDLGDRPVGLSYAEAVVAMAYPPGDPTDRVSSISRTPTGGTSAQQIGFTYDSDLVTGMLSSGVAQGQYQYSYNNNFFLTSQILTSGTDAVTTTVTYDADGLPIVDGPFNLTLSGPGGSPTQLGDGTANLTLGYDAFARVTSRTETVAGSQPYQAQVSYDAGGRIGQKVEVTAGVTHTLTYGYDANSQLTQVTQDGTVVEQYGYDPNGNRTSVQLGSSPPITATYDLQDRLTQLGTQSYTFDADGFLTQRGTDTFQYSGRGELLAATVVTQTVTYTYDGLARRVGRTDATGLTQYLYGNPANPFQVTAIRDGAGNLTTLDYDQDGLLIALQRGSARYYVATDQVGTPRVVTDSTGTARLVFGYDSFGNVTSVGGTDPTFDLPIGFAGGLADATTGLVHFAMRDYDPVEGRWTARDPALFAGGQGNLYGYVGNNPISQRDPLGLFCFGGSGYAGVGGGFQVCVNDQGASLCGEIGIGVGESWSGGAGGLASTDFGVGASLSADCLGFGGGGDLFKYILCDGPSGPKWTKISAAGGSYDPSSPGSGSVSPGGISRAFSESAAPCNVSGKGYIKGCASSSTFH